MRTIGYYTAPKLAEYVVDTIRRKIDTELTWLDNSYPLVQNHESEGETFPVVWDGSNTIDLRPDSSVDSYCFFEFIDSSTPDKFSAVRYRLNLCFWCDLSKIAVKTQDYTWNLIADVIRVLGLMDAAEFDVSYDPFSEYSFVLDKQQLMRQYSGFKIGFTVYGSNNYFVFI